MREMFILKKETKKIEHEDAVYARNVWWQEEFLTSAIACGKRFRKVMNMKLQLMQELCNDKKEIKQTSCGVIVQLEAQA